MRGMYGTVSVVLMILLFMSCQPKPGEVMLKGPLCGTWRMIEAQYASGEISGTIDGEERICYKLMSGEHFAVIEMYKANPDSQFFAAVGTYTLGEGTYTEYYEASSSPARVGTHLTFKSEIVENQWTIEIEASERTEGYLKETWELVSKPAMADAGM